MRVVVAVHVFPIHLTPGRTRMLKTLHRLARERGEGMYWEKDGCRGVIVSLAPPPDARLPTIAFVEDGSAVSYVEMEADVAKVTINEVYAAKVMHAAGDHETVYAMIEGASEKVIACVSEIHRNPCVRFAVGEAIRVKVLDTSFSNKTLFATCTCLGF